MVRNQSKIVNPPTKIAVGGFASKFKAFGDIIILGTTVPKLRKNI